MKKGLFKNLNIVFISTYPPRQCGLATFSFDLVKAICELQGQALDHNETVQAIALTDIPGAYEYPKEVIFEINEQRRLDYGEAAHFINSSNLDIACLQHEFGIFGGKYGIHVLNLLKNLRKPVVTTLHMVPGVLKGPAKKRSDILRLVCYYSTFVATMTRKAVELLTSLYGIPPGKIRMIPHGAPDVPFFRPSEYKGKIGAEGRPVILTFGLIGPRKGLEVAIKAMVSVVREFPDVLYIILGVTHSRVLRRFGDKYRLSLERLVKKNGLEKCVRFRNEFVDPDELITYLAAADIYLAPYRSKEQISSGTLTQALACGKAIICTPSWYAQELLDNGRGHLVPFGNSRAMAEEIVYLLRNQRERTSLGRQAHQYARGMIWPRVARRYLTLFERALK